MRKIAIMLINLSLALLPAVSYGAFVSGSTGADGAFNPTANTTVTLPPNGVLNYTTVNIPSGVTVTFNKNAANTPVYMLATGDVVITGTLSVNASNGTSIPGDGGPGGFGGGTGGTMYDRGGKGLGPGGGFPGNFNGGCDWNKNNGGGGGFGTVGSNACSTGGSTYGSERLLPLIGGSGGGGGGGPANPSMSGGGGGGAILVASSGTITVNGSITANGGSGVNSGGGSGSGGGIKLVANIISGTGSLVAVGGFGSPGAGGAGRIRMEFFSNSSKMTTNPASSLGSPGEVFVSAQPGLTITSIGGQSAPANPTGNYNQPDIPLPSTTTNPVTVNISAANIPVGTTVKVRVIPQYGVDSSVNTTLSGTDQSSTASANVTLSTTYSNIVTAEATFTVVAMYYNGEQIDKVHVAATMGGKSETTYITKSGKTIKGDLVAFAQ